MMFHAYHKILEGFFAPFEATLFCLNTSFQALLGVASEVPWDRYIEKFDTLDSFLTWRGSVA